MILSDCTDRNVAGVNESSFLYQSCYKLIVIDANLLLKWMHAEFFFIFLCHLQLIHLHPILVPVTPSCSLSPPGFCLPRRTNILKSVGVRKFCSLSPPGFCLPRRTNIFKSVGVRKFCSMQKNVSPNIMGT